MKKIDIYNMYMFDDAKYEELVNTVNEMYRELFNWGYGVKLQLFASLTDGHLFTAANPSTINIVDCVCLYSLDVSSFENYLSEEEENIIRDRYPDFSYLDWSELTSKISFEDFQQIKEEAITNLVDYCFDYYYDVIVILDKLEYDARYEQKLEEESKKYEEMGLF